MDYTNKEIAEYMNNKQNLLMLFDVKYQSIVFGRRYECLVGTIENLEPKGYRKIDIVQDMLLTKKFLDENSNGAIEFYRGKLKGVPLDREWKIPGLKCQLDEIIPYEEFEWGKTLGDKCEELIYLSHPPQ
ncbi:MAG: hypothetical protein ACOCZQ_02110 [Nanoarchaeota archaeon]